MKHIYVTRHGQTDWNLIPKVQGITDIPLNKIGIEQAHTLSREVKRYGIDTILYSPLSRASQTAKIVSIENNIPCREDARLTEQNFGEFEGFDCSSACKTFMEAKMRFADTYKTGESMLQLAKRVYNLLDELKKIPEDKNILLITHGGVVRMIHSYFFSLSNEEFASFGIHNCEIKEYFFR